MIPCIRNHQILSRSFFYFYSPSLIIISFLIFYLSLWESDPLSFFSSLFCFSLKWSPKKEVEVAGAKADPVKANPAPNNPPVVPSGEPSLVLSSLLLLSSSELAETTNWGNVSTILKKPKSPKALFLNIEGIKPLKDSHLHPGILNSKSVSKKMLILGTFQSKT